MTQVLPNSSTTATAPTGNPNRQLHPRAPVVPHIQVSGDSNSDDAQNSIENAERQGSGSYTHSPYRLAPPMTEFCHAKDAAAATSPLTGTLLVDAAEGCGSFVPSADPRNTTSTAFEASTTSTAEGDQPAICSATANLLDVPGGPQVHIVTGKRRCSTSSARSIHSISSSNFAHTVPGTVVLGNDSPQDRDSSDFDSTAESPKGSPPSCPLPQHRNGTSLPVAPARGEMTTRPSVQYTASRHTVTADLHTHSPYQFPHHQKQPMVDHSNQYQVPSYNQQQPSSFLRQPPAPSYANPPVVFDADAPLPPPRQHFVPPASFAQAPTSVPPYGCQQQQQYRGTPYQMQPPANNIMRQHQQEQEDPYSAVSHPLLLDQVSFVAFPPLRLLLQTIAAAPLAGMETPNGVFFGQIKFEVSCEMMVWLINRLTNGEIWPVHIHPRGAGCFMAYFSDPQQVEVLLSFHNALLFDERGFWLAETDDERQRLTAYATTTLQRGHGGTRNLRLPKRLVIIRR